jgi:threonine synthase
MISRLRGLNIPAVVEDSSGNAGAAVAAYCARAGLACTVYVPASAPAAKISQIKASGARVVSVDGPREAAAVAVRKAAATVYYAGHCVDPFFIQGTKTVAYEVAEQLGWRSPQTMVAPLGNGTLVLGLIRGFDELVSAGMVKKMPRIVAFQSRACNPLVRAFSQHDTDLFVAGTTIADGIAVSRPVLGDRILAEIRRVGGEIRDVSEKAIHKAWKQWAALGLCVEPTAAVALAGIDQIKTGDDCVVVATGHGLKRSP